MIRPLDIRPDHLEIVKSILSEHLALEVQVWIFGSRADWLTKDSSDLDIALEGKRKLSQELLGILKSSFEDSVLPFSVDVVDLNRVGEPFRRVVESQRIPLPIGGNGVRRNVKMNGLSTKSDNNSHTSPSTLPSGWREVALRELTSITRGRSYRSDQLQGSGETALVTLKSFKRGGGYREDGLKPYSGPFNQDQLIDPGEMVVAQTDITQNGDVVGRPAIVPQHPEYSNLVASLDAAIVRVKDSEQLDSRFLFFCLLTEDYAHHAKSMATGTTVLHLARDAIPSYAFGLPPLEEQRAIAHVLGTLDDKIELNRRMNEALEAMARALFTSWFVDFEPVRAKMDGRWRRGESLPSLPADLYDLFPDSLVPSQLGDIPEGWEVKPLDRIATYLNGLALQKYPPDGGATLPVIKIAQLRVGHSAGADLASDSVPLEYVVHDGDILFSWSGSLELDIWTGGDGALNQHLFKVSSDAYPKWLYYFWTRHHLDEFRDIAADKATTMGHIQRRHLTEALTLITPEPTLAAMDRAIAPLLDRVITHRLESRALAAQRDALLPRLVSGEVRV